MLDASHDEELYGPRDTDDRGEQIRNSIANDMWSDFIDVKANLCGLLGLSKWASIFMSVGFNLAPPDVAPSVSEAVIGLHGVGDSGPDMSFDTSDSSEHVSGLGRTSLAKVISYVSTSVAPDETIPHHVPQSSIGKSGCHC
uniref:Harbinger transposase-derived nuclease domain-containing protein n=1 Tax=Tanacetum cinerariifolium TaxID=118510 RepID=A0A6L2P3X0_TANCI|nr:harbinger transposase-derived nuclease domain-containing protein [Tanacetum cinerariifolium]